MAEYRNAHYDPWCKHSDPAAIVDEPEDTRTIQQNSCLHGYLAQLAKDLNDAGLDIRRTMAADFDIPWTPQSAKCLIWHQVQHAMYPEKKESTTALSTKEASEVYKVISRHMAAKNITTPWPTRFNAGGKE